MNCFLYDKNLCLKELNRDAFVILDMVIENILEILILRLRFNVSLVLPQS